MVETGSFILLSLTVVAVAVPLLPVCLLFIRRTYHQPFLFIIKLLCTLVFIQQLIFYLPGPDLPYYILHIAFRLASFTLLFYLFIQALANQQARNFLTMVLVSYISVVITIHVLKGIRAYEDFLPILQSLILIVLAVVALLQLISNRQITIFREVLFWIAASTIWYFGMFAFMETAFENRPGSRHSIQQEKEQLMLIIHIVRFGLLTVAAYMATKKEKKQGMLKY